VLSLILILLLLWFVLSVLLAAWTLWFQAYIYSEPVGEIYWRAPAAGGALALFIGLWVALDYRTVDANGVGRYEPLHDFSAEETKQYPKLWIINRDGKEEEYERRNNVGHGADYVRKDGRRLPERPSKIIVSEPPNGDKHVFEPDRDAKGNFKVEPNKSLVYRDDRKLEMVEGSFGTITIFHFGWLVMNLFLNFAFLVVWFLALWLLLQFQWSHALGLAVVFWVVTLLFVMPPVLKYAEDVAVKRNASSVAVHRAATFRERL
jgi:hypothetical protein